MKIKLELSLSPEEFKELIGKDEERSFPITMGSVPLASLKIDDIYQPDNDHIIVTLWD